MKRLLTALITAGALVAPGIAAAEASYVFERSDGTIYIRTGSGAVYDSQVGAVCGALSTELYFASTEVSLGSRDSAPLDNLADCFIRGPLAGVRIDVVASYDGSEQSLSRALGRQRGVLEQLEYIGVVPEQLTFSRELRPAYAGDRIRFRVADPLPWVYLYR